jgi:hypothetical protein
MTRRKKKDTKTMLLVAKQRTRRKSPVFPGNSHDEMDEKKKALRPKAATGRAVAVPR